MTTTLVGTDSSAGFATSHSVVIPAGAVAGDLLLVTGSTSRFPGWTTITDGLTLVEEILSGTTTSTDSKVYLFEGRVDGSALAPGATITWERSSSGSSQNGGLIVQCYHSDAGDAGYQYAYNSHPDSSAAASPVAPSITAEGGGILAWLVSFTGTGVTGTVPSGYTQQEFANRTHAFQLLGTTTSTAGATGTATGTLSADTAWNTLHIESHDPVAGGDLTAPTVTINAIHGSGVLDDIYSAGGYDSATNVLTVTGTAADETALDRVEVSVDGGTAVTATGTTSWSVDLDVSGWTAGTHTVSAVAYDTSENPSSADTDTVWHSPDGMYGAAATAGNHFIPVESEGYAGA